MGRERRFVARKESRPMPHRTLTRFAVALACVIPSVLAQPRALHAEEAQPTPNEASEGAPAPRARDDGKLHVGALAGVGFPRPLAVEGFVAWRWFVVGAEYGFLPETSIAGAKLSMWSASADARFFPFRGPFFLGLRAGRQSVSASATVSALGQTASGEVDVASWFVNPRVGLLWTWSSGFAFGLEAGVQLPIATKVTTTLPSAIDDGGVTSTAETYGSKVIPSVDLLRIGWML